MAVVAECPRARAAWRAGPPARPVASSAPLPGLGGRAAGAAGSSGAATNRVPPALTEQSSLQRTYTTTPWLRSRRCRRGARARNTGAVVVAGGRWTRGGGTRRGRRTPDGFGSIRRILPSRVLVFCALLCWLFPPPPSPVVTHRQPSAPKCSWPPLWFDSDECSIVRTFLRVAGSATSGLAAERVTSSIRMSPSPSRVVDVQPSARRVVRGGDHRQQPALAARLNPNGPTSRYGIGRTAPSTTSRTVTALLGHEQPRRVAGIRAQGHRQVERPRQGLRVERARGAPATSRTTWLPRLFTA